VFMNLLREVEAAEEVLEAGVGAERVKAGLKSHFDETPTPRDKPSLAKEGIDRGLPRRRSRWQRQ